jgi:uncharacterized protein YkwD
MALTNQQIIGVGILGLAIYVSYTANKNTSPQSLLDGGSPRNQSLIDKNNAPDAKVVVISTENDSKQAIQNINEVRKKAGKNPLNYSSKAYNLAIAIAKDMNQYGYFDFTNPKTKTCADNMKLGFGFTNEEYLAQSIYRYVPIGANVGFETKNVSQVAKEWVEGAISTDQNFLYPQHVAGAVGCDENKCVFLALNYSGYGKGCGLKTKSE